MKRLSVILAVALLALFAVPGPAKAAPSTRDCTPVPFQVPEGSELDPLIPIPTLCVKVIDGKAVATVTAPDGTRLAGAETLPLRDIIDAVVGGAVPPTSAPAPVAPPRAPATVTQTRVIPGPTPAPKTITETITVTEPATPTAEVTPSATPTNTPTGQDRSRGATVSAEPPSMEQPEAGIDLVPDDPETAAATYSILGLLVGILLGILGLYAAYRRGQINGEKDTLREFLGVIRNTAPRHRA